MTQSHSDHEQNFSTPKDQEYLSKMPMNGINKGSTPKFRIVERENQIRFQPKIESYLIAMLLMSVALIIVFGAIVAVVSGASINRALGYLLGVGFFLGFLGWRRYKTMSGLTLVFDLELRRCWRGKFVPKVKTEDTLVRNGCDFNNIDSVQLLGKQRGADRRSIRNRAYELNLILRNNQRFHLMECSLRSTAKSFAKSISTHLAVPVVEHFKDR